MAALSKYVDPDAIGGGTGDDFTNAYTSMSTAEAAVDNAYNGDNMTVNFRASSETIDNTAVLFAGATFNSAADFMTLLAAAGDEAIKTSWDPTRYRLEVTDSDSLDIRDEYIRVIGMQIRSIFSASANFSTFNSQALGAANDIRLDSCRIQAIGSNYDGITINDADALITVYNTIVDQVANRALRMLAGNINFYNGVVYGCGTGLNYAAGTTGIVKNTAVFVTGNDFVLNGTTTVDFCASDDNDGTNNVAGNEADANWTTDFNDAANGDFTILAGSPLKDGGINDPSSGLFSTDMEGDAYIVDSWAVGVDQIPAAPSGIVVLRRRRAA